MGKGVEDDFRSIEHPRHIAFKRRFIGIAEIDLHVNVGAGDLDALL